MSFAIDLASHGADLKKAYNVVTSSDPETTWAVFGYTSGNSLTVQDEGAGSLDQFTAEFDDAQVQYGLARVDYDSLTKIVLVGWVGESVPQSRRTAFNAHFAAVSRYFSGYHVQITANSADELTPQTIMKKVGTAAGSKYNGTTAGKPAPRTKPRYVAASTGADEDDWGDSKPLEVQDTPKLSSVSGAYKPTKVNIAELRAKAKPEPKEPSSPKQTIGGLEGGSSYKPVGKVDIAAIREAGKHGKFASNKPEKVESSYKPVGKVDIAAIRAQAKKKEEFGSKSRVSEPEPAPEPVKKSAPSSKSNDDEEFASVKDRMKAFSLDVEKAKPQDSKPSGSVAQRKAQFDRPKSKPSETLPWATRKGYSPERSSSSSAGFKDYGSENGKTPAQLWAEKHGKKTSPAPTSSAPRDDEDDEQSSESASISARRDMFNFAIKSSQPEPEKGPELRLPDEESESGPSFADLTSRFAKQNKSDSPAPAPPSRSPAAAPASAASAAEDNDNGITAIVEVEYDAEDEDELSLKKGEKITNIDKDIDENGYWWTGENSKGQSGMFPGENVKEVKKGSAPPPAPKRPESKEEAPPPTPQRNLPPPAPARKEASPVPPTPPRKSEPVPPTPPRKSEPAPPTPARQVPAAPAASSGDGYIVEIEYVAGDDDELTLVKGEIITDVDKEIDENGYWWKGTNSRGEEGLFPGENVRSGDEPAGGATATAKTNYEATEEDELSFKTGDEIVNIVFLSPDWWQGEVNGQTGLFLPENVELH